MNTAAVTMPELKDGEFNAGLVMNAITQNELSALEMEYEAWCNEQGLPCHSANELIQREGLSVEQREYLSGFSMRWERAEERL